MKQDLLAPPKINLRQCRLIAAGVCLFAVVVAALLAATGQIPWWGFSGAVARATLVVLLAAASLWMTARIVRAVDGCLPERMPIFHSALVAVSTGWIFLVMFVMAGGFGSRLGVGFLSHAFLTAGVTAGMILIGGGWGHRVGETLHCPRCEYEFGHLDDDRDPPARCPECGTRWLGLLNQGRKVRSWRMVAAGVAVIGAGLLATTPMYTLHRLAPHLPTAALWGILYVRPQADAYIWKELENRSLSASDVRWLAERVLANRADSAFTEGGGRWLEREFAAGRLPDDIRDRFFREGFAAELVAPKSVRPGEEIALRLRVRKAVSAGSLEVIVMFAGYSVDMGEFTGRLPGPYRWHQLTPQGMSADKYVFEHKARAAGAKHGDRLPVSAVYWVVYLSGFPELRWKADGTPTRPKTAVWFERVELETEVLVE